MVTNNGRSPVATGPTPDAGVGPVFHGRMGKLPEDTHPALQTDAFKEVINKLAWALGTTYRVPYSNSKTLCRQWALELAKQTLKSHGYPSKIGRD